MLSADSSDVKRRIGKVRHPRPSHILNKRFDFSEFEIFTSGMLNWQAADWIEVALGAEYAYDDYGPGWGNDREDMRLGENGDIVSGPDSNAIDPSSQGSADRNGTEIFVGSGWSTNTFSLISEVNLALSPRLKVLFSGRADKNTYSDYLFSPRVAVISTVTDGHYVKLIAQRSVRMSTAGQLYANDENDESADEVYVERILPTKLSLSIEYIRRRSFWFDLRIIFATLFLMIRRSGG